jgi:hypothetical protein
MVMEGVEVLCLDGPAIFLIAKYKGCFVGPGLGFTRSLLCRGTEASTLWPGGLLLDVSIHLWLWLCYELHECAADAAQNLAFVKYVLHTPAPFSPAPSRLGGGNVSFTCDYVIGSSGRATL